MSYYVEIWDLHGQKAAAHSTISTFPDVLAWFDQHEKVDPTLIWRIRPKSGAITPDEKAAFTAKGKRFELI